MAPRKAAARKTVRPAEEFPAGLVDLNTKDGEAREPEREPLFRRDGVIHTIPKMCPVNVALTYLELATTQGVGQASYYALITMLTPEGYTALKTMPNLSQEELAGVTSVVIAKVVGALAPPKAPRS